MKKLIFTLTFMLLAATFTMAQTTITISGTVTNSANNAAVPNHQVNILIMDSMSSYYFSQSVNTNVNGAYSVTVQNYPAYTLIAVSTLNCNNQTQSQYLWQSPYVANFSICVGTPPPTCQAAFTAYPDSMNPLTVHFYDQTSGTPTSWSWDFGDNSTSTLQHPTHTYSQNGLYLITLTVVCSNTTSSYSDSLFLGGGTAGCQANFTHSASPANSLSISFTNTSTGNPTSFFWNFGDNTTSTLQNPTHTYSQAGNYTVYLAINSPGCQDSIVKNVVVQGSSACMANYTFMPDSANPLMIHFVDQSTGNPTSWLWNFGDNSPTSTLQNPSHTYAQAGTYNISLMIFGPGCQNTKNGTITVGSGPSTGSIYGQIMAGNNFADNGIVYLIEFNSGTNQLTAIDTTAIDSMGYYGFGNVPMGTYYVKAALSPTSSYYSSYFPTYYGNQLLWSNATTITLNPAGSLANINLVAGNNPGGPGFIGGNVLQGANKGPGDPMEDIRVILLDMSDNPIIVDITDANGEYSFSNLAYGDYKVWIDIPGKTTTPAVVTIDATTPSVTNINMIINSTTIVAGIEKSPSIFDRSVGEIYPNPSFDNSKLEINLMEAARVDVSIFNSIGQLIRTNTYELSTGKNLIEINSSELENGIYTIRLESNIGQAYRKFVKVSK